jgi:hypothetical protein
MNTDNRPRRDSLEEGIAAFQRMRVPDRPPDAEVLARLGRAAGCKGRPVSASGLERGFARRVLLCSATGLFLICGVGLFTFVLHDTKALAVADVVDAAKKHRLVRYQQLQTTDARATSSTRFESTVYADLTSARLRRENRSEDSDGEAIFINVFDPVRHLETNPQRRTACLRRTPKDYKSFCCSVLEFEHHKGVTRREDALGGLATIKYRFEADNETSTLWVDARTKLPVRMEQELGNPTPDVLRNRLVWTDFEWDPELPKGCRTLDELFATQPPVGYRVNDQTNLPVQKRRPELLPQKVIESWQMAGARVGWMNTDEHTNFHARGGEEEQREEVPAFRFDMWPAKGVAKLPQPPRAFGLDLLDTQVQDAELKELAGFQNLRVLNLGGTKITDAALKALAGLTSLQSLDLANTKLTDAGLKELAALANLQVLDLGGTRVTDAGLKELAGLMNLQVVFVNGTRVTDAGLKALAGVEGLRSLCLSGNVVTDVGLKDLARLKSLHTLYLGGTRVTDAGVTELRKALPKCDIRR